MIYRYISILIVLLLFVACTSSPRSNLSKPVTTSTPEAAISSDSDLITENTPTPRLSFTSDIGEESPSSELYLLLRTARPPFIYRIARLSTDCFINSDCSKLEMLSGFPDKINEYSPISDSPLMWSPDGKRAIIVNANQSQLLVYNPIANTFETLVNDIALISDQAVWSPDRQQVALSEEGVDAFTSHILLVNPDSGRFRRLNDQSDMMQFPVGWLDTKELLLLQLKFKPIKEGETAKKEISEFIISKVDIHTDQMEKIELMQDELWLEGLPVLSPSGSSVILSTSKYGKTELSSVDLNTRSIRSLGPYGNPRWSPDGQWISVLDTESGSIIYVVRPDGTDIHKVFESRSDNTIITSWLPDNEHLFIVNNDLGSEEGKSSFYIASVREDNPQPIVIPGLDISSYIIKGVTLRPKIGP